MALNTLAVGSPAAPGDARTAAGRSRLPAWIPGTIAVLGGTALLSWRATYYGSWLVDDAAITFSYARSFTEGLGPVVHPGADPVEGFSNPTWLLLLGLGRLLGLFDRGTLLGVPDYVLFPKALAALCCAGILLACHVVARKVTRRPALATFTVGVVLTSVPSFVIWCFSGLENSLFALAVVVLATVLFNAVVAQRLWTVKVAVLAGVIVAFAALTRPDGLIYLAAYPLVLLMRWRRGSARLMLVSVAASAVPYGGYLAWRYREFGLLVPNTAVAKGQGIPRPGDLLRVGELANYIGVPAVLLFVVAVGMAARQRSWLSGGLVALLVPLTLGVLAYAALEPDWMAQYRFATPVWALSALVGTLATGKVFTYLGRRGRAGLVVVLVAAMIPSGVGLAAASQRFRDNPTFPMCLVAERFGRVFNGYADILELTDASLLAPDLGGTAMTTRLRVVDMAGLAEPRIARYTRDNDKAGLRDYVFDEVKPTFITSHGVWNGGTGVALDPRLDRDYHVIYHHDTAGDWVRKDAVADMAELAAARDYAASAVPEVDRRVRDLPRRQCGPVLRRGQVQ
jgi:hypothetical protein